METAEDRDWSSAFQAALEILQCLSIASSPTRDDEFQEAIKALTYPRPMYRAGEPFELRVKDVLVAVELA